MNRNVSPQQQRTAAEAALEAWFERRANGGPAHPLAPLQLTAFERFSEAGLPHRRVEAYKYSDLRARLRTIPEPAGPADTEEARGVVEALAPLAGLEPHRLVLANGELAPPLSAKGTLPGLTVTPIFAPGADHGAIGSLVGDSDDPLALLNTSLFDGGVIVEVADGARIERPIEIVHATVGARPVTVMPRLFVRVGAGAEVRFVERHAAGPASGSLTNALTELAIGEEADVTWVKLQGETVPELHFGSTFLTLGREARLAHVTGSTGTGFSRSQAFVTVTGEGAHAAFSAAAIAVGDRHVDHTLVVTHDAIGSESRERFRSVVGGGGQAIVQGRIIVAPGAQKTDAQMMSNSLFLDDDGEVVNKPELEIFADDVVCGHGATTAALAGETLFYLRSRGIPKADAERLLIEAFILEAAEPIADEALRGAVEARLSAALAAIGKGGAR